MRLTADVLLQAENYLNAYLAREICLRGLKIPTIENLSVLQDQFDVIDLTDNDIKKIENFPLMRRLDALLLSNNSIARVASGLSASLPNLRALMLANNRISQSHELENIAAISGCGLQTLVLLENAVTLRPHYRHYAIHLMPTLVNLDFTKVTRSERDEAKKFFASSAGKAFLHGIQQEKQQASASQSGTTVGETPSVKQVVLTDEQKALVKKAIEKASTKHEIDLIEYQLKVSFFEALELARLWMLINGIYSLQKLFYFSRVLFHSQR